MKLEYFNINPELQLNIIIKLESNFYAFIVSV